MRWLSAVLFGVLIVGGAFNATAAAITSTAEEIVNDHSLTCMQALQAGINVSDEIIVGTLGELLAEKVVSTLDLELISEGINPLSKRMTAQSLEYQPIVEHIVKSVRVNSKHFSSVIKDLIDEVAREMTERSERQLRTKDKFVQLKFYQIQPGELNFAYRNHQYSGKRAHQFWFSNIPVTQWQYTMVMGKNPSWFNFGVGSMEVEIPVNRHDQVVKRTFLLPPNHPVEFLLYEDALSFIKKLNLLSDHDDPLIYRIIPDHKKNWHYDLPEWMEWEFVAHNRGAWTTPGQNITEENIGEFAWFEKNSNSQTHPVGELKPFLIDGKFPIYDVIGNVKTWVKEGFAVGISFNEPFENMHSDRVDYMASAKSSSIGIRLVTGPPR